MISGLACSLRLKHSTSWAKSDRSIRAFAELKERRFNAGRSITIRGIRMCWQQFQDKSFSGNGFGQPFQGFFARSSIESEIFKFFV